MSDESDSDLTKSVCSEDEADDDEVIVGPMPMHDRLVGETSAQREHRVSMCQYDAAQAKSRPGSVFLSDTQLLKASVRTGERISFGSVRHAGDGVNEHCRPCSFERPPARMCTKAWFCDFCHLHGNDRRLRRKGMSATAQRPQTDYSKTFFSGRDLHTNPPGLRPQRSLRQEGSFQSYGGCGKQDGASSTSSTMLSLPEALLRMSGSLDSLPSVANVRSTTAESLPPLSMARLFGTPSLDSLPVVRGGIPVSSMSLDSLPQASSSWAGAVSRSMDSLPQACSRNTWQRAPAFASSLLSPPAPRHWANPVLEALSRTGNLQANAVLRPPGLEGRAVSVGELPLLAAQLQRSLMMHQSREELYTLNNYLRLQALVQAHVSKQTAEHGQPGPSAEPSVLERFSL